jgi:SpoVK/Ycf46/Vps4 family AAA+-type ATPase
MAKADQFKALVRTHAEGDDERFYAIAMQVAARAARLGQTKFAQELRDLVDEAKQKRVTAHAGQQTRPVPIVQPRGELAGLLSASYPKTRLADMTLGKEVRARIEHVLVEQRGRTQIREHGFSPLRKLLLIGPPGIGKTMTAAALAGELGLPLFAIQLDALITKYLGETAAKLRLIFDTIRESRAVYLFDEFDALGAERSAKNEVGEIRRVLNSFLQFMELDESDSLVVAATNHPDLLDRALLRRFDSVIKYGLPTTEEAEDVLRGRLALLDTSKVAWSQVSPVVEGLSHAELTRAAQQAAKDAILAHRREVRTAELVGALEDRRASHSK